MIPKHLSHKPIVGVDNYERIDGHTANNTDARALSVGFAQYGKKEISAKVFRKAPTQWSPQSEELPLHRCIDLCTLIVKSLLLVDQKGVSTSGNINPIVYDKEGLKKISEFYKLHKDSVLMPKLRELQDALNTFMP